LQHQRAEPASLGFGQHAHHGRVQRQLAHVDERNLQALREHFVQFFLADQLQVRDDAAELAPGALLFRQRLLQLLFGNELVFEQQLA
jgi:hypothetical protein